jgi:hypothetical protein
MLITREKIIKYWLSEPAREPIPAGFIQLDQIPFPVLTSLSPAERKEIRRLLSHHPEYLQFEIFCESVVN